MFPALITGLVIGSAIGFILHYLLTTRPSLEQVAKIQDENKSLKAQREMYKRLLQSSHDHVDKLINMSYNKDVMILDLRMKINSLLPKEPINETSNNGTQTQ